MAFTYTTRKDGRLMKRVSVNGKLKTLYSDNARDLEKQYIEYKHLDNKGADIENETITVSTWTDEWLKTYKKNVTKGTYKMYSDIVRLYIKPNIGNIKLKKLKQSDIVNLINKLEEKNLTKTITDTLILIKSLLNKAVENDYIYKNVALGITAKRRAKPEKIPLTTETINKITELAQTNDNAFMILFLIYTGLRRGEVIPLQYKDIDIDNKIINVDKAVYIATNQPEIKDTKNHESRKVPIFNIIYNRLVEMKKKHNNDEYVFPSKHNKIMSQTSIRRKLDNVLHLLNKDIEKDEDKITFTLHQLRHTFACILYKAGIDAKQAQLWTGHKDIRVLLDIYTHLDSQDNQQSVDKVNQFLA